MPIEDNWNQSKCICENGKYLKTTLDNSKLSMMKLCMSWIFFQQI